MVNLKVLIIQNSTSRIEHREIDRKDEVNVVKIVVSCQLVELLRDCGRCLWLVNDFFCPNNTGDIDDVCTYVRT